MGSMAMLATPTLMEATEPMDTATPMLTLVSTTARGLLRLSLRPMLRLTPTTTVPTDLATTDSATEPMDTATHMLTMATTTARGPLMLSLSQRLMLMLTTGTTAMPGPTGTGTDTAATGATTGDKFSVLRSTKQKLKANITPCYL